METFSLYDFTPILYEHAPRRRRSEAAALEVEEGGGMDG